MENLKNNKKLIVVVLIIIIIAIVFMIKNTNKTGGGYSVSKNEALKIKESNSDITINVDTVDEPVYFDTILSDKTAYTGVKLSIKNNSDTDINIIAYNFSLLGANDIELAKVSTGLQGFNVAESVDESELLASDIPAGQTVSGYLYFETDSKDIKKLKVARPTKNKTNNKSVVAGQEIYFEYYYINL